MQAAAMTHLQAVKPSAERIADFCAAEGAAERVGNGWVYDALCGWTLVNAWRAGSIDGSRGFYHYDAPLPGAVDRPRRVVNSRGLPCRIHSFGDSFTHCDQVSDGETWQEFLAGHIQEPVKNFGVGGYSVHQACTRMERVELGPETATHIILNIYDDDHFRNLDALRSIRSPGTGQPFTLPHLRVEPNTRVIEERPNLIADRAAVWQLRDDAFLLEHFGDDPTLRAVLGATASDADRAAAVEASRNNVNFGIDGAAAAGHTALALASSRHVVAKVAALCEKIGAKLLVVLSFSQPVMAAALRGEPGFDRSFVDWLSAQPFRSVDMREAFVAKFARSNLEADAFLKPFFIGHHTPLGNFLTAHALKDAVVQWLGEPKPAPYAGKL